MRYYDKCITLAMITRRMPVLDMTVIYDLAIVALRILMPVYAIIIVYQCYAAMRRRRRPEKPLVTLYNTVTGLKLPVIFWENSIGRSRASDIVVDDPAVSRNHCVLLRRASGWYICKRRRSCGQNQSAY